MPHDEPTFPPEWLVNGIDSKTLDEHVIDYDRWDMEDLRDIVGAVPPFPAARKKLQEFSPTGKPALDDTFWTLLKAAPEVKDGSRIKPSHIVNQRINEELQNLPDLERLRYYSVGDDVQAALSASTLESDLETLFDRLKTEQQQAQDLEQTLSSLASAQGELGEAQTDLDELMERWSSSDDGDDSDSPSAEDVANAEARAAAAQDLVDQLQQQAQGQSQELNSNLDAAGPEVTSNLRSAISNAADEAKDTQVAARMWGVDDAEMKRMPATERIELAKKLNNPRFRQIAERFGPMWNTVLSEQARRTVHVKEEIYDIEVGNDLSVLVPSELQSLGHPLLKRDFYRRYAEHSLLQYAQQGEEKLARGGIVFCEDGSGSMSGDRELWAKAFMLCLLHLARRQKRTMHLVHFGSRNRIRHIEFTKPEHFTFERIMEAAEVFFGGGTDFQTPMSKALEILEAEHDSYGGVRADVVFVTDDECAVTSEFMEDYLDRMHKLESTTWGISVSQSVVRPNGSLAQMTENKVATVRDFISGDDVRHVFRQV